MVSFPSFRGETATVDRFAVLKTILMVSIGQINFKNNICRLSTTPRIFLHIIHNFTKPFFLFFLFLLRNKCIAAVNSTKEEQRNLIKTRVLLHAQHAR